MARRVVMLVVVAGAAAAVAAVMVWGRRAPPAKPAVLWPEYLPGLVTVDMPRLPPLVGEWYAERRIWRAPAARLSPKQAAAFIQQLKWFAPEGAPRQEVREAARERRWAAHYLGYGSSPKVIAALVHARDHDPDWSVYRAAKRSLAVIDPKRFADPGEEEAIRLAACLRKMADPLEGVEVFLRCMAEREKALGPMQIVWGRYLFLPAANIERAREMLIDTGAPAVEPMLDGLAGKCPGTYLERVHSALVAIGRDAVPALLLALAREDKSSLRRRQIISALGDIGDPRALPALRKVAKHSDDEYMRRYAWEAIGKIEVPRLAAKGHQAVPELIAAVERQPYYPEARRAAICALGDIGDARALPVLRRIASTANSPYLEVAEEAIAKIEAAG